MAICFARRTPSEPSIATDAHEIGRMPALPYGAAATRPGSPRVLGGRKRARGAATPIGPIPGPPPPSGLANVLGGVRWQTPAPMWPGLDRPTLGVVFAPAQ